MHLRTSTWSVCKPGRGARGNRAGPHLVLSVRNSLPVPQRALDSAISRDYDIQIDLADYNT